MKRLDDILLEPDLIFDGAELRSDCFLSVSAHQKCQLIPKSQSSPSAKITPLRGIVAPGFIDLQVNGGGGVLFNETPDLKGIKRILEAHRSLGTTAIMPTVITDRPEVLEQAVETAIAAKDEQGVLGLHIEGPHISPERRGTHALSYVRPFDPATLAHIKSLRDADVTVMITVAPEIVPAKTIAQMVEMGAIVSLGHSNATAEIAKNALEHGAQAFTHLHNAMPPMMNRAPGIVAAALNSDAYTGLIGDGYHVDDEMIKLTLNARPKADRVFIVSDAMPTLAGPPEFTLYGQKVALKDGRLLNSEGGLAGAHISMSQTVQRFVNALDIDPVPVLKMASTVPACLIERTELSEIEGLDAGQVIVLEENFSFNQLLTEFLTA